MVVTNRFAKRRGAWWGARSAARQPAPVVSDTRRWRICRFERIEERFLMAADIHLGVVYDDAASGGDVVPNTFTVTWSGGAPGTELKQLTINTDPVGQGLQVGEVFFNSGPGTLGAYASSPLNIVKHDGFDVSGQNPPDGSQLLTLSFSGFTAGKELVFTIDVDQKTFLGSDAIAEGAEFEDSKLSATFSAPHYADLTGNDIFYDSFNDKLQASGLNLPGDDYLGGLIGGTTVNTTPVPVLTAGAFVAGQQTPLPITLEGIVYVDSDLDNVPQPGEPGITGVQLTLLGYNGASYVPTGVSTTTDNNGHYKITGVLPGQYEIVETQPAGYFAVGSSAGNVSGVTDGASIDAHTLARIVVLGGEDVVQNDFSQALPNSISGHVRTDTNGDCQTDPNAKPIAGVVVQLLDAKGNVLATTATDAAGYYSFTNLAPGTYAVRKQTPAGYFDDDDHVGSAGGTLVDLNNIAGIKLTSAIVGVNYDFCEALPVSISGHVRTDVNGDCQTAPNATPIAGVVVQLLDAGGNVLKTTTTDASGSYSFQGLPPATYGVHAVTPAGYFAADDHVGSAGGTIVNLTTLGGAVLTSGMNGVNYDFCEALPVSISGHVRTDVNGDCQTDPDATPIAGVVVQLLDAGGSVLQTTTTDAKGEYDFQGLPPATYGVHVVTPAGYFADDDHVGSAGGTIVNVTTLGSVVLTSGVNGINYDFCEALPVSISGHVRTDANGDCQTDPNALPIAGVVVQLLDANGNLLGTTTTDAKGYYSFQGLGPDTYGVHAVTPAGYFADDDHVGSAGGTIVNITTLGDVVLTSGTNGVNYDFCELQPASLSGVIRVDQNGNCDTNPNAPPLAGVTVQLLDASGNLVATTVTNANGVYTFTGLMPGVYSVHKVSPAGYFDDDAHVGTAGGNLASLDDITGISLGSGAAATGYDFCEQQPVSIAGFVKLEIYGDCETTPTDPPLAGVTIQLLGPGNAVIGSTTTDAAGQYVFSGMMPGTYGVREITPAGYFYSDQHVGTAGGQITGEGQTTNIGLTSGEIGVGYDFCLVPPSTISGYVFIDGPPITTANPTQDLPGILADLPNLRSGVRVPGDPPVPGVTLMLADATGMPLLNQSGNPIETTTDAYGFYQFSGLPPGLYSVLKVHPNGYIDGIDRAGTLGGLAISPTLIQAGVQTSGLSASDAMVQAIGSGRDAIARIPVSNGAASLNNNFSEILLAQPTPPLPNPETLNPPSQFAANAPVLPPQPLPAAPPVASPAASPYIFSSSTVSGVTWHLSVIDAGMARGDRTALAGALRMARMRADVAAWYNARMRGGLWTLHPQHPQADEARKLVFGKLGGTPITGDFDGDGLTDVGVFVDGEWFIDLNGNGVWDEGDLWAKLGNRDDKPVTGDWDGDGKTDIGIYGPAWPGDPRAVQKEPGLPEPGNAATGHKNLPPELAEATHGYRQMKRTRGGALRPDVIDHVFHFGT
ncbi:MAG TPA: SdrD B-like domain-containing protein, partial [Pirellulales bacterium]|nr:SdrD B-like domain-containing protein [Pirellulales bacterium]